MLLVYIIIIYFTYNATLVKNSVLLNHLDIYKLCYIATRLKKDITWGKVHSTIIFKFAC